MLYGIKTQLWWLFNHHFSLNLFTFYILHFGSKWDSFQLTFFRTVLIILYLFSIKSLSHLIVTQLNEISLVCFCTILHACTVKKENIKAEMLWFLCKYDFHCAH